MIRPGMTAYFERVHSTGCPSAITVRLKKRLDHSRCPFPRKSFHRFTGGHPQFPPQIFAVR
jgi:hypothetical protein